MTEENKKRQENETIKGWLKRTSIKDEGKLSLIAWNEFVKRKKTMS